MGMMACLPCYLTTPGRLKLLMCGLSPPFAVNGALHGLGGEKAEAPSTPRIISGVGFEPHFSFLLWYK
jgi:hypothetical protein